MRFSIFVLLFTLSLGFFGIANAQFNVMETQVNLELIPENPQPNEIVQASANSYATNIDGAKITWSINGKTISSGVGNKVIQFKVGDMGTQTVMSVTVQTVEGETIQKTITLNPSSVDLIWQSKGFVPPFYKGKSLFSHQNELTVIAIPHLSGSKSEIPPKNIIYTWKKDGKVIESASGYGKNEYTFQGSLISRPIKIEVAVSSQDGGSSSYAYTEINPIDPDVILYRKHPLFGIQFQKALTGSINIDDLNEITVVAMPYSFGSKNMRDSDFTYKWSINGVPINNQANITTQVFRKKEGATGSSNISVSIENSNKILQFASSGFSLVFNSPTQNSI